MSKIYLNGRVVDESRAKVSALDRGLLYGDGLFETMRAYGGRVFRLDRHLARLASSAKALRIPLEAGADEIESAIARLLRFNGAQPPSAASSSELPKRKTQPRAAALHQKDAAGGGCAPSDAYVRITLTRGIHAGDLGLDTGARPTLIIQARAFHGYPAALYRRGMRVALAAAVRPRRSAAGRHKTLGYLENLIARDAAKRGGFDETLFLDDRGFVAECATSNIFFVAKGQLFTPAATMNILPGITRAVVMELARAAGVKVEEGRFRLADVKFADEVFLTNSLMEIMPVCEVAGRRIARHAATRELALVYRRLVSAECR